MTQDGERIPLISSSPSNNDSSSTGFDFSWSHVSVETREPSSCCRLSASRFPLFGRQKQQEHKSRQLLGDVFGIARRGQVLAIMGTSGVGKTTLLNVLSGQYDDSLTTTGEVYLNGRLTTHSQRLSDGSIGYVEQNVLFIETMTLEEHLIFQAMLRMPRELTDDERRVRVTNTVAQLHLTKCKTTTIKQLSGGERKRLAFATIILIEPQVMLIDEPTSGLDAYLAKSLMAMIRSTTIKQNRAVIVVLHQPSSGMFDLIDTLCLLVHGGRQAFFGSKDEAVNFFTTRCHLSSSSLDGYVEQLAAPPDSSDEYGIAQKIAADEYAISEHARTLQETILVGKDTQSKAEERIKRASFGRQLKWLLWRSFIAGARNPVLTTYILIRILLPAFILSLIYFHLHRTVYFVQNVDAVTIVAVSIVVNTSVYVILGSMPTDIHVCVKENSRGMYSVLAYYLSVVLHNFPTFIVIPFIYSTILYWMSGIDDSWLHYMAFVAVVILASNTGSALGELFASFSDSIESAISTAAPFLQTFLLFSGFFLSLANIPSAFRVIQYLSPFYYGYATLFTLQWDTYRHNAASRCDEINRQDFPNTNKTFSTRMISFASNYCTRSIDSEEHLRILRGHIGFNIAMLFLLFFVYHAIAFAIIWYRAHQKRLKLYFTANQK